MRAIRLAIAALVALGLAFLPMSAGLAVAFAAEMSMDAPDMGCPHCETAPDAAADVCDLSCCGIAAIFVAEPPVTGLYRGAGVGGAAVALLAFLLSPDPPPPRS